MRRLRHWWREIRHICPACNGSGSEPNFCIEHGWEPGQCYLCDGTGRYRP